MAHVTDHLSIEDLGGATVRRTAAAGAGQRLPLP
jgi:hypothetical protein